MRYRVFILFTAMAGLVLGSVAPAMGAYDMFLKIDGIDGESTDKDHQGWIEVESFSWGMSVSVSSIGTGGGAGKANFLELSIDKFLDKASPRLMLTGAEGRHLPAVHLVLRTQGETRHSFFEIELKNVFVTSLGIEGQAGEPVPTETLSLNYEEIKVTYTPQRADGGAGDPVSAGWNIAENRRVDTES